MNNDQIAVLQQLAKTLEAGGYGAAPGTLTQGAALQREDLSSTMEVVTFQEKSIKIQKQVPTTSCKSMLYQFVRQLSYGIFGGTAQLEGHVGQEETSEYQRVTVPMAFYSHVRRVTIAADMVDTFDGQKASERAAQDAAKKIAADIEFEIFRGRDDFSNNGVFDGNPLCMPQIMAGSFGLGQQVRESDYRRQTQDAMFSEFGSEESVVISGSGTLTQGNIEDAHMRSNMNHGEAEALYVDPKVASAYNKLTYGISRIILGNSAQEMTGSDLRRQAVSNGQVTLEICRFLSGKTGPQKPRERGPSQCANLVAASVAVSGVTTPFAANERYHYFVCAVTELGEGPLKELGTIATVANAGEAIRLTITKPASGTVRNYNVYRSEVNPAGGADVTKTKCRYIGRVADSGSATTLFYDLGNKLPGFVTGMLIDHTTMERPQLAPYSRQKLAMVELITPEAHYTFQTLAVKQPRKNVAIDNLRGALNT